MCSILLNLTLFSFLDLSFSHLSKFWRRKISINKATGPAASSSFICGLAALRLQPEKVKRQKVNVSKWRKYALKQLDYMLGSSGRSFVVDYGINYPTQPFHKVHKVYKPRKTASEMRDHKCLNTLQKRAPHVQIDHYPAKRTDTRILMVTMFKY